MKQKIFTQKCFAAVLLSLSVTLHIAAEGTNWLEKASSITVYDTYTKSNLENTLSSGVLNFTTSAATSKMKLRFPSLQLRQFLWTMGKLSL